MADPTPPPGYQLVQAPAQSGAPPPPPGYQLVGPAPDPKNAPTLDYYDNFAKGPDGAQPTDNDNGRSLTVTRPKPSPLDAAADAKVAQEAAQYPVGHEINDTILSLIRGTPIGSWVDEIGAGASGAANYLSNGEIGAPYDDAKAYMDARIRSIDNNSKTLGHIPTPFGDLPVTTEGLKELTGGIASAPFTPIARIFKGASLLPAIGNDVATGIGLGALYGAGNEDGDGRVANAVTGMETGGAMGAVIPPAARGFGNLASGAVNMTKRLPSELSGFAKGAIDRIAPAFDADGVRTSVNLPASRAFGPQNGLTGVAPPLGPEGMLLDYGPSLKALGSGIVQSNGPQRSIAVNALQSRKAFVKPRIVQDADSAFGQPVDLPEYTAQAEQAAQARAAPLYDKFKKTKIKISENMHGILDRANAVFTPQDGGLFPAIQQIMKQEGINPNNAGNNGQFIDLVKQALDSKVSTALKTGDTQTAARIGRIASDLRNETDAILRSQGDVARDATGTIIRDPKTNLPKSIYQHARDTRGEDFKAAEAVEYGGNIFDKNLSADQVRFDMKRMTPDQREHVKIGAREKVRMIMSSNATKFGDNGDSAIMSALGGDEAQAKLALIVSPARATALINRLKAESTFEKTRMPLIEGSQTALNTDARKLFPTAAKDAISKHNVTMEGLVLGPVMKIADMLTLGAITEKNIRIATDAAKMLVAQGGDRDMIARGLRKYLSRQGLSNRSRVAITRVANTIGRGSRGVLVNSQTTQQLPAAHP